MNNDVDSWLIKVHFMCNEYRINESFLIKLWKNMTFSTLFCFYEMYLYIKVSVHGGVELQRHWNMLSADTMCGRHELSPISHVQAKRVSEWPVPPGRKSQQKDRLQTAQEEEKWIVGQQRVREQWNGRNIFYNNLRTWHIIPQTAITEYKRGPMYLSESTTSNSKGEHVEALAIIVDKAQMAQWPGTRWNGKAY